MDDTYSETDSNLESSDNYHEDSSQIQNVAKRLYLEFFTFFFVSLCVLAYIISLDDPLSLIELMMWPWDTKPWMFVTSIFLHAGFEHLLFNIAVLHNSNNVPLSSVNS